MSAVRRAVGQALAKRRLDAPEDYARLQVARLTKALRCADVSLEEGDLKAIAPFVKVVRELNLYHGVNFGPTRTAPGALPEIAPTSPPNSRPPGIDIAPGDRYGMNGVVPPGYAYSARQHPPRDWLTKFAFPPEGYRTLRVGQLEQNRAS